MNCLLAGFARIDVTPQTAVPLEGYYIPRYAEGVLDPLQVNALALSCQSRTVVLLSLDNCGIKQVLASKLRNAVAKNGGACTGACFLTYDPYPYRSGNGIGYR